MAAKDVDSKFSSEAAMLVGFAFFLLMYLAGNYISTRFALPIPGSIIGLGLTLLIVILRRKVDAPLREGASTLLRYLPLMLVPIGVGVSRLRDIHAAGIWRLVAVLLLALIVGVICTAKIMEAAMRLYKSMVSSTESPNLKRAETNK